MIIAVIGAIGVVVAACLGLLGVWLSDRAVYRKMVADANQTLVENLQEERTEIKRDLAVVKRQVAMLMLQGRYKDDYINVLRDHIERELGPPPPAYPPALLRIASEGL